MNYYDKIGKFLMVKAIYLKMKKTFFVFYMD